MSSPRLVILNCVSEEDWRSFKALPRFVQPLEHSKDPCRQCPGWCCQADVRTTAVEAVRIALTVGVPILHFVDVVPAAASSDSVMDWPIIPVADGEFRLRMSKVNGWCTWLHRTGERGTCAVHGQRPGPCRLYPFDMTIGERHVVVGSQKLCPVAWVKTEAMETRVHEDLKKYDLDLAAECALIDAWKVQGKGGMENFLAFAILREGLRMGFDMEELGSPPRKTLGRRFW